jgi:Protein of unknown function (DUF3800)
MVIYYEMYVDETKLNVHHQYYWILGGLICTDTGRDRLHNHLRAIREELNWNGEMKWNKISKSQRDFVAYKAWVDVFFRDPFARYSLLIINQSDKAWTHFQPHLDRRTKDDKLASAYHQFLLTSFGNLHDTKRWAVYADPHFFSNDNKLKSVDFLFNRTYKKAFGPKTSRVIHRMQSVSDSKQEDLIQLSDVLLGIFSHNILNIPHRNETKLDLLHDCAETLKQTPKTRTGLEKCNHFFWVPPSDYFSDK